MARIFIEGGEEGKPCGLWTAVSADNLIMSTPPTGFTGSYYINTDDQWGVFTASSSASEWFFGFKYKRGDYSGSSLLQFKDSAGTVIASVRVNGSDPNFYFSVYRGNGATELATGGSFAKTEVLFIQLHYKPLNSAGLFQIKIDGTAVIDIDAGDAVDTTAGLENVQTVNVGTIAGELTGRGSMDDLVIDDAEEVTNTRIQKLQISGVGTTGEWDASTGNPYECVDEIPYSDTDYIYTNVSGESATFACADLTGSINSIKCLAISARMSYEGSPSPTKQKIAIRVNGSEYYGDDMSPALTFGRNAKLWVLNPDDSAAWEEGDINAIEIGVRSVA
jgi:hypothetical protein